MQEKQEKILDEISKTKIDKEYEVYFEEIRNNGLLAGKSDNNALVQVEGKEEWLGNTMRVKITNPKRLSLYGEVVH